MPAQKRHLGASFLFIQAVQEKVPLQLG